MDKKEKKSSIPERPAEVAGANPELDEFFRSLKAGRPKAGSEGISAALDAAQRFATEQDAEDAASDAIRDLAADLTTVACKVCGYHNREGNKFCGMCGATVNTGGGSPNLGSGETRPSSAIAISPDSFLDFAERPPATQPTGNETHHYHHHYHHHYFPGAAEGGYPRGGEPMRDVAREDKLRSTTMALRGDLSRAEASVRAITQEWVLACNTKHLDDLLELYASDALLLRSNYPPIRGAAAVREFFFGTLNAGLGEVEMEPIRKIRVAIAIAASPFADGSGNEGVPPLASTAELRASRACRKRIGNARPRFAARARTPVVATGLKKNLWGAWPSKTSDNEHATAALGDSENPAVETTP